MATAILEKGSTREARCRHGRCRHDSEAAPVPSVPQNVRNGKDGTEGHRQPLAGRLLGGPHEPDRSL
eukprot:11259671-Alexandrium_andersonii.AAC.1